MSPRITNRDAFLINIFLRFGVMSVGRIPLFQVGKDVMIPWGTGPTISHTNLDLGTSNVGMRRCSMRNFHLRMLCDMSNKDPIVSITSAALLLNKVFAQM